MRTSVKSLQKLIQILWVDSFITKKYTTSNITKGCQKPNGFYNKKGRKIV